MPRKKTQVVPTVDVGEIIDKFVTGLRSDLAKLYSLGKEAGFLAGAEAERKRVADLFMKGAVTALPSSTPTESKTPTKSAPAKPRRKNWWDTATPEQKAARLASLAAARDKNRKPEASAATEARSEGLGEPVPTPVEADTMDPAQA